MKEHIFYYSSHCPDCPPFKDELDRQGLNYEAVDITASMKNLKRFLALRDNRPEFDERKQWGFVGVPVLHTKDDQFIFELNDLNGTSCKLTNFEK
ncbi:glutaredoxin [Carnobacteriaceae bacterium zg-ZUI252]|nr:glutaredoxin [Carnobacteriaceae bacterium zg-ZUI252]MBS4769908.1 glutaredoxin [Carnobacteriaceae bacterium zg-ZUI240]